MTNELGPEVVGQDLAVPPEAFPEEINNGIIVEGVCWWWAGLSSGALAKTSRHHTHWKSVSSTCSVYKHNYYSGINRVCSTPPWVSWCWKPILVACSEEFLANAKRRGKGSESRRDTSRAEQ